MSDRKNNNNRSRWAADDEDTPSSFSNGNPTAEEMQARMAAVQSTHESSFRLLTSFQADYGIARQHQLSTAVRRDQRPATTSRNIILAARDCNVAGTEAAENARANQARLQGWGSELSSNYIQPLC